MTDNKQQNDLKSIRCALQDVRTELDALKKSVEPDFPEHARNTLDAVYDAVWSHLYSASNLMYADELRPGYVRLELMCARRGIVSLGDLLTYIFVNGSNLVPPTASTNGIDDKLRLIMSRLLTLRPNTEGRDGL